MTLNVRIDNRDFTTLPLKPFKIKVDKLAWTAYGGPDHAQVTAHATLDRLLDYVALLRCPLTVSDPAGDPVWWGYINKIEITFNHVKFFVSMKDLFNKVKVLYTYLAPDNHKAELYDTTFSHSLLSQSEYGIKERVLYREAIDDAFALALRDTFLKVSQFPRTQLTGIEDVEVPTIRLYGLGWIHTLGWRFYENQEGYYANHGPGPGQQVCANGTVHVVAQRFLPAAAVEAKFAYFMLRAQGAPVMDMYARLYSDAAGSPNALLATSAVINASTLSATSHQWVKFTFAAAYALAAGTHYWIGIQGALTHAANHFYVKTDENMSFSQKLIAKRFTAAWAALTPIVMTTGQPHLYFRLVCTKDSGALLKDMASATGQFFTGIQTLSSGVLTTPYRTKGLTTLQEIQTLMQLGTVNQRKILATVTPDRRLTFYEAPNPLTHTATLDPHGRFSTIDKMTLPRYRPPIGQYALLTGVDRFSAPFDLKRTPAYFVDRYAYRPCLQGKP